MSDLLFQDKEETIFRCCRLNSIPAKGHTPLAALPPPPLSLEPISIFCASMVSHNGGTRKEDFEARCSLKKQRVGEMSFPGLAF